MRFSSRLLGDGEDVILELHPHWAVLVPPALVSALALGVVVSTFALFPSAPAWTATALAVLVAIPMGWLGVRTIRRAFSTLVVTSYRLVWRSGILAARGWEMPLVRVFDVSFRRSILQRLIGAGNLVVDTGGEAGVQTLEMIPHPEAVQSLIFEQAHLYGADTVRTDPRAAPVVYASGPAGLSVAEQIEKLDELRRRGVITDEEFLHEKSRLIGL